MPSAFFLYKSEFYNLNGDPHRSALHPKSYHFFENKINNIIFDANFIDRLTTLNQLEDIIEGLHRDSPQAMKSLFEQFYKPLCFYVVRYAGNMSVAEEIVSDVMYKIWQNRHHAYRAETFREYLYIAARNTALNYVKQQQNQRKLHDEWADNLRNELIEETPLDAMITEETQSKINALIDALPEQCRKAFMMSRIDDLSYEEIASQMDISVNTVKYHIKTALQKLRAGMGDLMLWLIFFLSSFWILFLNKPTLFLLSMVSYSISQTVQLILS